MKSFSKLTLIVGLSSQHIALLFVYTTAVGFLTLVVPITAQSLVTLVSFGTLKQPLVIVSVVLFVLLASAGFFTILHTMLIEAIKQKLFTVMGLKIAKKLIYVQLKNLNIYRGTELVNRFFDVVNIQKNIGELLLVGLGLIIQSFLGLILLAFYHPFLLVFDLVFICALVIVFTLPWKKGLSTAFAESDAKYNLVAWLEEIARLPMLFRFQNHAEYAFRKTDAHLLAYLTSRQAHFRQLIKHISGAYAIQVLASSGLFLLGGLLVMNNQMTLGQLVAAEIIVTSLGLSVTRAGRYIEKVYDLLAAGEKVYLLLSLETEPQIKSGYHSQLPGLDAPPSITVENLNLKYGSDKPFSFKLLSKEKMLIIGEKGKGKSFLVNSLLGFNFDVRDKVFYNNFPLSAYDLNGLRKKIAFIRNDSLFDGILLDNLSVDQTHIELYNIRQYFVDFKLGYLTENLDKTLSTELTGMQHQFSNIEKMKFILIRALLSKPYLIIIHQLLDSFSIEELDDIIPALLKHCAYSTVIVSTRRPELAKYFTIKITL